MKLSKKIWLDCAILLVAMPIVMVVFGTDLPLMLPLLFVFIVQIIFDNQYPKYKHQSQMISYIAMIVLAIFVKPYIDNIFEKDSKQICGTLIKNEHQFFYHSLLNPSNIIIKVNDEKLEFRSNNSDLLLNSQVCINYIESEDNIWFFNDYVLSIKKAE